jgi:hypothetical protein
VQFQALATMSSREENLAVVVASCAALIMASLNNKKRKTRCWWQTELYKKRSGSKLMLDVKSQYICGQYKNIARMSPTTFFENLLSRIGSKISKEETFSLSDLGYRQVSSYCLCNNVMFVNLDLEFTH